MTDDRLRPYPQADVVCGYVSRLFKAFGIGLIAGDAVAVNLPELRKSRMSSRA